MYYCWTKSKMLIWKLPPSNDTKAKAKCPETHKQNSRMTWTWIYFLNKKCGHLPQKEMDSFLSKCHFHFLHLCPGHPDVPTNCFFSAFRDYRITSGGPALYLGMTSDIWIFTKTDPPSAFWTPSPNTFQYYYNHGPVSFVLLNSPPFFIMILIGEE